MARRRGWSGAPPIDHHDAQERIVDAAAEVVDRLGPDAFSLSEVAKELGVSRPTVYRYFPSTDELLSAVGQHAMQGFTDQLRAHLAPISDPAEWVVETIACIVEWLPARPHMTLLLAAGRTEPFARGFTSAVAIDMTRAAFEASSIDWFAAGFSRRDIDDLIQLMLRLAASLLVDPPQPPYSKPRLRQLLRRWIAPGVNTPA